MSNFPGFFFSGVEVWGEAAFCTPHMHQVLHMYALLLVWPWTCLLWFFFIIIIKRCISATYSSFHFQTSSTNFSLPRSCLEMPLSFFSLFSTTTWVAIPAWSQPGFHNTFFPFILCLRNNNHNIILPTKECSNIVHHYSQIYIVQVSVRDFRTYHLVTASSTELVRAWPRWRLPVTLGGGRQIINWPLGEGSVTFLPCIDTWNILASAKIV